MDSNNVQLCIFGCGNAGMRLFDAMIQGESSIRPIFCDNDNSKYDSPNFVVISPAEAAQRLTTNDVNAIIIPDASLYGAKVAMWTQLLALGVDPTSIFVADMKSIECNGKFETKFLKKLSALCMDEFNGYDKPAFTLGYHEVVDKRILLVGNKKYVDDIADFFNELEIIKRDKITVQLLENELYVLCEFDKEKYTNKMNELGFIHKAEYIWMEDLIQVLRESETYFTMAYHPNRPVVMLGDKLFMEMLARNNPNMPVYAKIEINDWHQDVNAKLNEVKDRSNSLFLIVTSEYIDSKAAMQNMGYKFGVDYYFYYPENVRLSDMLLETIKCVTFRDLSCSLSSISRDITDMGANIMENGNVCCCCNFMKEPLGNFFCNSMEAIITSPRAKVLMLSISNKTYCFCKEHCPIYTSYSAKPARLERTPFVLPDISEYKVSPSYLQACPIFCRSCRTERILDDTEPHKLCLYKELIASINKIGGIRTSNGELMFSPLGRHLLETDPNDSIELATNGMIMNQNNLKYLLGLYTEVTLRFSIDGGTNKTFEYLRRGAKWETVMENLHLAGEVRKTGKLKELSILCVVQRDNFRELEDIVLLGQKAGVDNIYFYELINWGTFASDEYNELHVHDPANQYYDEFVAHIATKPVFMQKNVWFVGLKKILDSYSSRKMS